MKAKKKERRFKFAIGNTGELARGKAGEYYDSGSTDGLGLRVGASGKATWFVRFQHAGKNINKALGTVDGTPTVGKTLPPLTLEDARNEARVERLKMTNPRDTRTVISLREAFEDYLAHHKIRKGKERLSLSDRTRFAYQSAFDRHLERVASRDFRTLDKLTWEGLYDEVTTGLREGKPIMLAASAGRPPRPRKGSISQAHILFSALSGMYRRRDVENPIAKLRAQSGGFGTPEPRDNVLAIGELPRFFGALRGMRSSITRDLLLLSILTAFRREAILQMERAALDLDARVYRARMDMEGFKRAKPQDYPLCPWLIERVLRPRLELQAHKLFLFEPSTVAESSIANNLKLLARVFGRRVTPNDARRTFSTMAEFIGIPLLRVARLTGHAAPQRQDEKESTGERTTRRHYIKIDAEVLRHDSEDITNAILEAAGELPLGSLLRTKLARYFPDELAALDSLVINQRAQRLERRVMGFEPEIGQSPPLYHPS